MAAKTSGRGSPPSALQVGRERGGAGRVVRGVEQQLAAVREAPHLEPARPVRARQPGLDRLGGHGNAARVELLEQAQRDRGVRSLMGAREADRHAVAIARARRG